MQRPSATDGLGGQRPDPKEEEAAQRVHCVGLMVCLLVFLGSAVVIYWYGPTELLRAMLLLVPRKPGWDWYLVLCLLTTVSIVLLMPIWPPLCMAAGLIFGFLWGFLHNFVAIVTAAAISMTLGRNLLQEPVREWLEKSDWPTARRMIAVLEDEEDSLKFQVLFRFLFIPMFLRNYGPSTLRIPLWKLFLASLPHSAWISLIFASLGATFKDAAELIRDGKEFSWKDMKWQQVAVMCVSTIVGICLAVYAHYKYKEHLEKHKESDTLTSGLPRERPAEA